VDTYEELNQTSSIPFYVQIREILLRKISLGDLRENECLPSERELSEQFGVSRMTIRQAVQTLVQSRVLYTRVGKGTYVAKERFEKGHELHGFTEEMHRFNRAVSNRVLDFDLIEASEKLAEIFNISPGAPVFKLARLRLADGIAIAFETAHLPKDIYPDLMRHDFLTESLYEVLRKECRLHLISAEETAEAAIATPQECELLGLDPPAAVFRFTRRTRTDKNIIAEYVEAVNRGDAYIVRTRLVSNSFNQT
jgi:GntR family transcriptional regulator